MAIEKISELSMKAMLNELSTITRRVTEAQVNYDVKANKKIREELESVTRQLSHKAVKLDPVLRPDSIFDPSDPHTAGRIIALALVAQPKHPLGAIPEFYGAGVYAIYYDGPFGAYASLSQADHPIYVGKADPSTPSAQDAIAQGIKLSVRLREHARSIQRAATTLDINHFQCRFLIVQSGFQKSAEDQLINFFKPIWNSETKICFGLGKHGDSSETRVNRRSPWDTLHPGRPWADATSEDQKPYALILAQIRTHFEANPPYADSKQIFDDLMLQMRQLSEAHFHLPQLGEVKIAESTPVVEQTELDWNTGD